MLRADTVSLVPHVFVVRHEPAPAAAQRPPLSDPKINTSTLHASRKTTRPHHRGRSTTY